MTVLNFFQEFALSNTLKSDIGIVNIEPNVFKLTIDHLLHNTIDNLIIL